MPAVQHNKPPPLSVAADASHPSPPQPDGPRPDGWTIWVATEKQRNDDTRRELRTALLMAVVVLSLGGAIYLSFAGTP